MSRLALPLLAIALLAAVLLVALAVTLAPGTWHVAYATLQPAGLWHINLLDLHRGTPFDWGAWAISQPPLLSPDRRSIAWVDLGSPGERTPALHLWDRSSRRASRVSLPSNVLPVWSPRGDRIAYTYRGDLFTVAVRDGNLQTPVLLHTLADDGSRLRIGGWSPAGDALALTAITAQRHRLVGATLDGTVTALVDAPPSRAEMPVFSPDGDLVVFGSATNRDYAIYMVTADTTGAQTIARFRRSVEALHWSPDGRYLAVIAYGSNELHLHIVDLSDGTTSGTLDRDGTITGIAWSPDSRELVFVDARNGDLYRVRRDGSGLRRLTDVTGFNLLLP